MFYQIPYRKNCGLRFIGNLPVSEGDLVWTDGNVIFGHVSPKDTPLIPMPMGGIPCAFDNSDANGFFKKSGTYKEYNIAVDAGENAHIVNDEKKYFHFNTPCFDAEVSDDGKLLTAELDGINGGNNGFYFIKEGVMLDDDCVVIKKDGKEIEHVYLRDYADAIDKTNEIASRGPVNEKFVAGHAQLLNFHLNKDGSWDALIASFAYGRAMYKFYIKWVPTFLEMTHTRRISAHYLIHVKSNNYKEYIHEDLQATVVAFQDELSGNTFSDEGVYVKNYNSSWLYPAQDDYYVEMDEWQISKIFAPNGKIIFQQPLVYPRALWRITADTDSPDIPAQGPYTYWDFRYLYTSQKSLKKANYRAATFRPTLGMYYTSPYKALAPVGNHYVSLGKRYDTYYWDYIFSDMLAYMPAARLPSLAIAPLDNGGYLIGLPFDKLYKIDKNGNISLVNGNKLHNFRLRYLKNISKAKK